MNINQVCMKCMTGKLNENGMCISCGADNAFNQNGNMHLPVRTILKGKYLVGKVIGEGGFGITYIGYDLDLEIRVAIKEFCPKQYVGREAADGMTVYPYNAEGATLFEAEKEKFINEARRLAKFRNEEGVVSVQDYFIENGTAYIVMDYIDGETLKSYLKSLKSIGRSMSMGDVLNLFKPVMETLAKIHKENIIHRDISPENIMISKDFKKVYLIDFGTARQTENGLTLSEYYKGFYTPIEQRSEKMKQGPWTDVYALCATIYVCVTGRTLPESVSRLVEDDLIAPSEYGAEISPTMEAVLLKGLAVKPEGRIRSMEELMQALYGEENRTGYRVQSDNEERENDAKCAVKREQIIQEKQEVSGVDFEKVTEAKKKMEVELKRDGNKKIIIFLLLFLSTGIAVPLTIACFAFFLEDRSFVYIFGILLGIWWVATVITRCSSIASKPYLQTICPQILTEEIIILQSELMRKSIPMDKGVYRGRQSINKERYIASCSRNYNKKYHWCHHFSVFTDGMELITFNRFDLLNYYNQTILPSPQISDELKVEWKKAAIESWVLIED